MVNINTINRFIVLRLINGEKNKTNGWVELQQIDEEASMLSEDEVDDAIRELKDLDYIEWKDRKGTRSYKITIKGKVALKIDNGQKAEIKDSKPYTLKRLEAEVAKLQKEYDAKRLHV